MEPLLLPLTESGGAKRTQGAVAGGCFAALTPGAAARRLTAPRSCSAPKKPLQLTESGGAKRTQGAVAGGCFAALPLEAAARRKQLRACTALRGAVGRSAHKAPSPGAALQPCRSKRRRGGKSSALVQHSVELLVLPLTESGRAKRTQGAVAGGCFAALPLEAAARR